MTPETLLIILRMAQDFCAMLLWGGFAYLFFLVPRSLAAQLGPQLRALNGPLAHVMICASLVTLPVEAASFGDGWPDALNPENLSHILVATPSGTAWCLQLLGSLIAGFALALSGRSALLSFALAGGLELAGRSLIGHGVMHEGSLGLFLQLNYLLHLLATGTWVGALLPFILIVAKSSPAQDKRQALAAIERFSNSGIVCVMLILVTGTINTALIFGHWPSPAQAGFSRWLFVKLVLVALMVALALANRFTLNPRLEAAWDQNHKPLALAASVELLLGTCVLILVNIFSAMNPH